MLDTYIHNHSKYHEKTIDIFIRIGFFWESTDVEIWTQAWEVHPSSTTKTCPMLNLSKKMEKAGSCEVGDSWESNRSDWFFPIFGYTHTYTYKIYSKCDIEKEIES